MSLAPGTTLGPYRITEPLGQGGMATVYRAFQPSLDREIALKVLRPGYEQDPDFRERFEREAKAIARLRHPHIVQVFDFVVADGHYALAMEYLDGGTLKERLAGLVARGARMDGAETARIVGEVAGALDYAHEQGVIHRDVKPSNVMLSRKDRAVITDFGIARILGSTSHTQTGVGIGTPEYMAPEQGQGARIDHRADIYSLGVTAYEMLLGRVPYTADTPLAVVLAHMKDPLPAPSAVDPAIGPAVERALVRALEKDPAARYESAGAFAAALRDALGREGATATLPTVVTAKPSARAAAESAIRRGAPAASSSPPRVAVPRGAWLALVAVVAVAIGVVAGQVARPAPTVGSTPTPSAAVTATAALPSPVLPARGQLLYAAKLDGTVSDLADVRSNPSPADAGFRPIPGAIEGFARRAGAAASADLAVPPPMPLSYVGEIDLAVTPGSDVDVNWTIRGTASERTPRYLLQVRTKEQVLQLIYLSGTERATLTEPIPIAALQSGQRFTIAVALNGAQIRLYLSGREVAQVTDQRVSSATGRPNVDVFGAGANGGGFQILGARFYGLP